MNIYERSVGQEVEITLYYSEPDLLDMAKKLLKEKTGYDIPLMIYYNYDDPMYMEHSSNTIDMYFFKVLSPYLKSEEKQALKKYYDNFKDSWDFSCKIIDELFKGYGSGCIMRKGADYPGKPPLSLPVKFDNLNDYMRFIDEVR